MISVTILGNNSALPAYGRFPTAQIVTIKDQHYLIDCGEGTQIQMQKYGHGWRKLNHIFISHLHGDHYFGLIGLITSMNLQGRTTPLYLYGPQQLLDIINIQVAAGGGALSYDLVFHPIADSGEHTLLFEDQHVRVTCFPVEHRIPCHGFLFETVHKLRKINPEACSQYQIPTYFLPKLKEGEDYTQKDGTIIRNEWVTVDPAPSVSYAYCADTRYTTTFYPYIQHAHTIYHETTYLKDNTEKAIERFHSTAEQAATTALNINAQQLLIGHFSSRYEDLTGFLEEAQTIFPNTHIAEIGTTFELKW